MTEAPPADRHEASCRREDCPLNAGGVTCAEKFEDPIDCPNYDPPEDLDAAVEKSPALFIPPDPATVKRLWQPLTFSAHERPLLLVANHRSFFDMYVVSAELFRRTKWRKELFFPVRGRFFYESLLGMFVNLVMGWWSMYPPFFAGGDKPLVEKREFDKFSMRRLVDLCQHGAGHIIGFHPEGTRNKSADPYSFLRPQPGIGRVIKAAEPQVVPVFIAGLGNNLPRQILGNWTGGPPIRIHFGPALDLSEFKAKHDRLRTYKEIADFIMTKIAELGEQDKEVMSDESMNQSL